MSRPQQEPESMASSWLVTAGRKVLKDLSEGHDVMGVGIRESALLRSGLEMTNPVSVATLIDTSFFSSCNHI